jgi:ABC-type bacteriocin/lantibiotic exporter with double-glycine peptidase domain
LRQLIRLEAQDLRTVFAFAVGSGLMALAPPIAVQSLVNTIAFGALLQPLAVLVVILFASLAFNNLLIACQIYVVEMMQRRLFVRLLGDIAGRLQRVMLEAFDRRSGPCELSALWSHFVFGIKAPLEFRRYGAGRFPA